MAHWQNLGELVGTLVIPGGMTLSVVMLDESDDDGNPFVGFYDGDDQIEKWAFTNPDAFDALMAEFGAEMPNAAPEQVQADAPEVSVDDSATSPVIVAAPPPAVEQTGRIAAGGGKRIPTGELAVELEARDVGMFNPNQYGVTKGMQQFYTAPEISAAVSYVLGYGQFRGKNGSGLGRVLDPTAGNGQLLSFVETDYRYGMDIDPGQIRASESHPHGDDLSKIMPKNKRGKFTDFDSYARSIVPPYSNSGSLMDAQTMKTYFRPGYNTVYGSFWKYAWRHAYNMGIKFDTLLLNPPFGLTWRDPRDPSRTVNSTILTMELALTVMASRGRGILMTGMDRFVREVLPAFKGKVTWIMAVTGTDWFGDNAKADTVCAFFRKRSDLIIDGDRTDDDKMFTQELREFSVNNGAAMTFEGIPVFPLSASMFYETQVSSANPTIKAMIKFMGRASHNTEALRYLKGQCYGSVDWENNGARAPIGFNISPRELISSRTDEYFGNIKKELREGLAIEIAAELEGRSGRSSGGRSVRVDQADDADTEAELQDDLVVVGEEPTPSKWRSINNQIQAEMRADCDGASRGVSCELRGLTISLRPSEFEAMVMLSQDPPLRKEIKVLKDLNGRNVSRLAIDHAKWAVVKTLVRPANGKMPLLSAEEGFIEKVELAIKSTLKAAVPMYPINPMQRVGYLAYMNMIKARKSDPFPPLTLALREMNFKTYRGEIRIGGTDSNGNQRPSEDLDYFQGLKYDSDGDYQSKGRWIERMIEPRMKEIAGRAIASILVESGGTEIIGSDGSRDTTLDRKPSEDAVVIADLIVAKMKGSGIGLVEGKEYSLKGETRIAETEKITSTELGDDNVTPVSLTRYNKWNALYLKVSDPSEMMDTFEIIDMQYSAMYLFDYFDVPDPGDIASERPVEFDEAKRIVLSVFTDANRTAVNTMERMRKDGSTLSVLSGRLNYSEVTGRKKKDVNNVLFSDIYRDQATVIVDGKETVKYGSFVPYMPRGLKRNADTGELTGYSFQLDDVSRMAVKGSGLLSWEQGLGKTGGGMTFAKTAARWRSASAWSADGKPTKRRRPARNIALFVTPQDLIPQWQNSCYGTLVPDGHGNRYFERGWFFPTRLRQLSYNSDEPNGAHVVNEMVNGRSFYVLEQYPTDRSIASYFVKKKDVPSFESIVRKESAFYTLTDSDLRGLRNEYIEITGDKTVDAVTTEMLYGFTISDADSLLNGKKAWPSKSFVKVYFNPDNDSWTTKKPVRPPMPKGTKPESYIPPAKPVSPLWFVTHHEGLSQNMNSDWRYSFESRDGLAEIKKHSDKVKKTTNELWKIAKQPGKDFIKATIVGLFDDGTATSLTRNVAGRTTFRAHLLRNIDGTGCIDELTQLLNAKSRGDNKDDRLFAKAERFGFKGAGADAKVGSVISALTKLYNAASTQMPVTSFVGVPGYENSQVYKGLYDRAYNSDIKGILIGAKRKTKWRIQAITACPMTQEEVVYCPKCTALSTEGYRVVPAKTKRRRDGEENSRTEEAGPPKFYSGSCEASEVWDYVPVIPETGLTYSAKHLEVTWKDEFLSSAVAIYMRAHVLDIGHGSIPGAVEVYPGQWLSRIESVPSKSNVADDAEQRRQVITAFDNAAGTEGIASRQILSPGQEDSSIEDKSARMEDAKLGWRFRGTVRTRTIKRTVDMSDGSKQVVLLAPPRSLVLRPLPVEGERKTFECSVYFGHCLSRQHRDFMGNLTLYSIRLNSGMDTRAWNRSVRKEEREALSVGAGKRVSKSDKAVIHGIMSAAKSEGRELTDAEHEVIASKAATGNRALSETEMSAVKRSRAKYVKHFKKCNYVTPRVSQTFAAAHYLSTTFKDGTIVVDEVQFIKSEDAQRSIGIRGLRAKHKLGMTGTPIGNIVRDLFWQLWFTAGNDNVRFPFSYEDSGKFQDEFSQKAVTISESGSGRNKKKKTTERPLPEIVNITSLWRIVSSNIIRRKMDDPRLGVPVPKVDYAVRKFPFGRRQALLYAATLDVENFMEYFSDKYPDHPLVLASQRSSLGAKKFKAMSPIIGQFQIMNFATTFPRNDRAIEQMEESKDLDKPDVSVDTMSELSDSEIAANVESSIKGVPAQYNPGPKERTNWIPKNWSTLLLAKKHAGIMRKTKDGRTVGIVGMPLTAPPAGWSAKDWVQLDNDKWGKYGENVLILSDILDLGEWLAQRLDDCGVLAYRATVNGSTLAPAKRSGILNDFKAARGAVMCAGIKALGVGHDLTTASVVIINGIPWSPAELWQGIGRVRRLTSPKPVTAYVLLCYPGSMDERRWDLVQRKQNAADLALEGKIPEFVFREQSVAQAFHALQEALGSGSSSAAVVADGEVSEEDKEFIARMTEVMEASKREVSISYSKPGPNGLIDKVTVSVTTVDEEKLYQSYAQLCGQEGFEFTSKAGSEEFSGERDDQPAGTTAVSEPDGESDNEEDGE